MPLVAAAAALHSVTASKAAAAARAKLLSSSALSSRNLRGSHRFSVKNLLAGGATAPPLTGAAPATSATNPLQL